MATRATAAGSPPRIDDGGPGAGGPAAAGSLRRGTARTPAGLVGRPAEPSGEDGRARFHDLDALRGFAMLLGILLHAGVFLVPVEFWPVHEAYAFDTAPEANVYAWILSVIHGFRMPLFFLLSGFFSAMLWQSRGLDRLARHRLGRVGLPLLAGMFTVVPGEAWVWGVAAVVQVAFAWLMCFGAMGLFRWIASKERFWVRYLSDASYWLYLVHLPLVIGAQRLIVDWPVSVHLKFVLINVTVVAVLLLAYQTGVRYTAIGRMLNGPRAPRPAPPGRPLVPRTQAG